MTDTKKESEPNKISPDISDKLNGAVIINEQTVKEKIYTFRGQKVMIDSELAQIYGYSTKDFNRQVKNNIEKFENDFMFQLTDSETEILRCKISTSNWGGSRYNPYVFTEQGIYMLMTVLKGELAVKQSKALIRTFRQMKDYIIENQGLIGQREFIQLSIQTNKNTQDIMELKRSLSDVDDKTASIIDKLGNMVTKSELADLMLDFGNPQIRRGWLILNGQPVESDMAYSQIYSTAKKSIFLIDNYIGLKTLVLLKNVLQTVNVTIFSDNVNGGLHKTEFDDFKKQYGGNISLKTSGGIIHDRYIVLDYNLKTERIYHCGASSKDGGNRVTTISEVSDRDMYHSLVDSLLKNNDLMLK